jgi:hypothetical protein
MLLLGHKRPFKLQPATSGLAPIADLSSRQPNCRGGPITDPTCTALLRRAAPAASDPTLPGNAEVVTMTSRCLVREVSD